MIHGIIVKTKIQTRLNLCKLGCKTFIDDVRKRKSQQWFWVCVAHVPMVVLNIPDLSWLW